MELNIHVINSCIYLLRKCILFTYTLQNRKGDITQLDPKAPHLLLFGVLDTHEPRGRPDFSSSLVLGWCLSFFRFLYDSKRKASACTILSSLNLLSFKGKALCCIKELQRHSDMQLNHPFCFNDTRKVAGSHMGD